jgi:Mn2+/Fe2+ NRAMP family transporter
MINPKHVTKGLLFALISFIVKSRKEIWAFIQPYPRWWKLILALIAACFLTVAFLFATNMQWLLFELFGYPQL